MILQTILIHIPDMHKSHKTKTNSFDSPFRYDKYLYISIHAATATVLPLILSPYPYYERLTLQKWTGHLTEQKN